jgi:predicted nuclease of predicted toxin-antitoxin system
MPERPLRFLIDQNIPYVVTTWLKIQRPVWLFQHVKDLGFEGKPDSDLYKWAQANEAIVITYDEDFADSRLYPLGAHPGVIRLKVWPTTIENTQKALSRLLLQIPNENLPGSLIIIDNYKIRVRKILKP